MIGKGERPGNKAYVGRCDKHLGRNKSFVCMRSRNCIIDIINRHYDIIIILISSTVGDVSKLPGDGDLFQLVLL